MCSSTNKKKTNNQYIHIVYLNSFERCHEVTLIGRNKEKERKRKKKEERKAICCCYCSTNDPNIHNNNISPFNQQNTRTLWLTHPIKNFLLSDKMKTLKKSYYLPSMTCFFPFNFWWKTLIDESVLEHQLAIENFFERLALKEIDIVYKRMHLLEFQVSTTVLFISCLVWYLIECFSCVWHWCANFIDYLLSILIRVEHFMINNKYCSTTDDSDFCGPSREIEDNV